MKAKTVTKTQKTNSQYKIGNWYRVLAEQIICSTDMPEWGIVIKTNHKNDYGWKPRGRIHRINQGDLVMISGYTSNEQIIVLGHQDKFVYTDCALLIRNKALGAINAKQ